MSRDQSASNFGQRMKIRTSGECARMLEMRASWKIPDRGERAGTGQQRRRRRQRISPIVKSANARMAKKLNILDLFRPAIERPR